MYKNEGQKVGTKLISVRIRHDLLDWMEMAGINKNAFINHKLLTHIRACQRGGENYQEFIDQKKWTGKTKNR